MLSDSGRLRLDLCMTDGSQYDADASADGVISACGAPARIALTLIAHAPDPGLHPFWF